MKNADQPKQNPQSNRILRLKAHLASGWTQAKPVLLELILESAVLLQAMAKWVVKKFFPSWDMRLINASRAGNIAEIKALLDKGIQVNEHGVLGHTALHAAASHGELEVVRVLLAANANPNAVCKMADRVGVHHGFTPLHMAVQGHHLKLIQVLIDAGATIDALSSLGTPLHFAKDSAMIEALTTAHAKVDMTDALGSTALHKATSADAAKALIEAGASVLAKNKAGDTPLHTAAYAGLDDVVDILLKHHADINATNMSGDTPLHKATAANAITCAIKLIKANANVNIMNGKGHTAIMIAYAQQRYHAGQSYLIGLLHNMGIAYCGTTDPSNPNQFVYESTLALFWRYERYLTLEDTAWNELNEWIDEYHSNAIIDKAKFNIYWILHQTFIHPDLSITLKQALILVWCGMSDIDDAEQIEARRRNMIKQLSSFNTEIENIGEPAEDEAKTDAAYITFFNKIIAILDGNHPAVFLKKTIETPSKNILLQFTAENNEQLPMAPIRLEINKKLDSPTAKMI